MTAGLYSQGQQAQGGRGAAAQPAAGADAPAAGRGAGGGGRGAGRGGANAAPAEPTPRMPDGTVNFGRTPADADGVWNQAWTQNFANQALDAPPRGGGGARGGGGGGRGGAASEPWIPFLPWSAAVYDYNNNNQSKYDPQGYCLPPGGPRLYATPYPMVWIQQPELKRMYHVFEGGGHVWREIYMDGRAHPPKSALNGTTWLGHSVGRWEGDTLVVDVVGFNEGTWIDYYGHPHTDQLHLIERWTRPNKQQLRYEVTIDDPGAYSKPWTITWTIPWAASRIDEYICQENNGYLNSLKDDFGKFIIDRGDGK
jgi:hypothetical protein